MKPDWHTCDHEWNRKLAGDFVTKTSYQWQCQRCLVYSYAGPFYDLLPDKSKSVFLYGNCSGTGGSEAEIKPPLLRGS